MKSAHREEKGGTETVLVVSESPVAVTPDVLLHLPCPLGDARLFNLSLDSMSNKSYFIPKLIQIGFSPLQLN